MIFVLYSFLEFISYSYDGNQKFSVSNLYNICWIISNRSVIILWIEKLIATRLSTIKTIGPKLLKHNYLNSCKLISLIRHAPSSYCSITDRLILNSLFSNSSNIAYAHQNLIKNQIILIWNWFWKYFKN